MDYRSSRKRGRSRSRSRSPHRRSRRRSSSEIPIMSYSRFKDSKRGAPLHQVAKDYCAIVHDLGKNATFGADGDFFREHKNEEWFQEKYKPSIVMGKLKNLAESSNVRLEEFKKDFDNGRIYVNRDLESKDAQEDKKEEQTESNVEYEDNALFIVSVPAIISKKLLEETFSTSPGYVKLSLAEANRFKGFSRVGWVYYDSQESCKAAQEKLNETKLLDFYFLHLLPNKKAAKSRKMREAPAISLTPERISKDLEQAVKVMKKLDTDRKVESNFLLGDSGLLTTYSEPLQKLNLCLAYLRKVHLFCYYCAKTFLDDDEVRSSCFNNHVRKSESKVEPEKEDANEDDHVPFPTVSDDRWSSDLDSKINRFLDSHPYAKMQEDYDHLCDPFLDAMCEELEPGKARCGHCSKLFRGTDFVRKHILNKHKDVLDLEIEKFELFEFFRAYSSDPDHPYLIQNRNQIPGRQQSYASGPQYPPYPMHGMHQGPPHYHAPPPGGFGYAPQPMGHYAPPQVRIPYQEPMHYQPPHMQPPVFVGGGGPPVPPHHSRERDSIHKPRIQSGEEGKAPALPPVPPVPEHARRRSLVSYKDFDSAEKEKEVEIDYGF